MSLWACAATASVVCIAPGGTTIPGGKPEIADPGLTPRSPLITLGPVLETALDARTAKLPAVPSDGAVAADTTWMSAADISKADAENLKAGILFAETTVFVATRMINTQEIYHDNISSDILQIA